MTKGSRSERARSRGHRLTAPPGTPSAWSWVRVEAMAVPPGLVRDGWPPSRSTRTGTGRKATPIALIAIDRNWVASASRGRRGRWRAARAVLFLVARAPGDGRGGGGRLLFPNGGEGLEVGGDLRVVGTVGSGVDIDGPGESGHGRREIARLGEGLSEPAYMHGQTRILGAERGLGDLQRPVE